ncbi:MAG: Gfo/Idh/MocA family protein, partial [Spirochaetota bacterium]
MKPVRTGIIGLGNMGSSHAKDVTESDVLELAGLCDIDPERLEAVGSNYDAPRFADALEMMDQAELEALIVATPHYDHTPLSIAALERGIHVLCEKPVGVHVKDVRKMIDAYGEARRAHPDLKFAAMFQQRTYVSWQKIKQMIAGGELGKL